MPQNWKTFKLGDLTSVITKGTTPSTYGFDFETSGINYIRAQSLNYDGTINQQAFSFISNKAHDKLKRSQLQANDILFSMAGAYLGMVGMVKESFCPANTNQAVGIIRVNNPSVYPKFVEYALRNPSTVAYVNSQSGQSAQPNINLAEIGNLTFSFPPIKEQIAIASILSALDDKIELNLQMNKTLEEMAMALYKHWFVDFGPFQNGEFVDSELGMIPEGWEVKRLDEIAHKKAETFKFTNIDEVVFVNTGDVQEGRFLHSNTISKVGLPGQAKKAIATGDILYSEIRPKNKRYAYVNFDASNYVVSTKFMVINPKDNILNKLLYRILTMQSTVDNFNSIAEGRSSTFPQITFDAVSEMEVVLPPLKIQREFQSIVEPIELEQDELYTENQTLTTLRDTLLPKLISGEVRVKDVEKILTTAL